MTTRNRRRAAFNEWKQGTGVVLDNPKAKPRLRRFGEKLLELNRDTYQLVVIGDVARGLEVGVPRGLEAGRRIGILPRHASDGAMKPYSGRYRTMSALLPHSDETLALLNPQGKAVGGAMTCYDEKTGLRVKGAPMVVFKTDEIHPDSIVRGILGAQQLVRASDAGRLTADPDIYAMAYTELLAHLVGSIVARAAIESNYIGTEAVEAESGLTAEVEELRKHYNVDADELLSGRATIDEDHNELVVGMDALGAFDHYGHKYAHTLR